MHRDLSFPLNGRNLPTYLEKTAASARLQHSTISTSRYTVIMTAMRQLHITLTVLILLSKLYLCEPDFQVQHCLPRYTSRYVKIQYVASTTFGVKRQKQSHRICMTFYRRSSQMAIRRLCNTRARHERVFSLNITDGGVTK